MVSAYVSKLAHVVAISVVATVSFYIGKCVWEHRSGTSSRRRTCHILFFPDANPTCRTEYTSRHGCTIQNCRYSHEDTSFSQLMKFLGSARKTLDLCVFVMTSPELADLVIQMHHQGVKVRIITDKEQIDAKGSQVGNFRAEGIQVRHNATSFLMHHKFALIDGKLLLNGSFNWTRAAVTGNNENLLITNEDGFVSAYEQEFEKLWSKFDPATIFAS